MGQGWTGAVGTPWEYHGTWCIAIFWFEYCYTPLSNNNSMQKHVTGDLKHYVCGNWKKIAFRHWNKTESQRLLWPGMGQNVQVKSGREIKSHIFWQERDWKTHSTKTWSSNSNLTHLRIAWKITGQVANKLWVTRRRVEDLGSIPHLFLGQNFRLPVTAAQLQRFVQCDIQQICSQRLQTQAVIQHRMPSTQPTSPQGLQTRVMKSWLLQTPANNYWTLSLKNLNWTENIVT